MYTLQQLGWSEEQDRHFREYEASGFLPGRISNEQRGHYYLLSPQGELRAEASGKVLFTATNPTDLPKVGDWVAYQQFNEDECIIHAVLPRRTTLSRKDPGGDAEQILAANVDTMLILQGLDNDFNPRRLERYLITARAGGVQPIVLLNKSDLIESTGPILAVVKDLVPEDKIIFLSALYSDNFEHILSVIAPGTTAVLVGSSGAGKSTLLNRLLGRKAQATNAVREDDSRGRHTTTSRTMFMVPGGGLVIDTPGMRELGLWTDGDSLDSAFADIEALMTECKFSDCTHNSEPGCAIRTAIEEGRLSEKRLRSFEKLGRELAYLNATDAYLRQKNEFFKTVIVRYKKEMKGKRD